MPTEPVDTAESAIQLHLRLLGGHACLDFVNTVDPRTGKHQRDFLLDYDDLVAWAQLAGILSPKDGKELRAFGQQHPQQAAKVFAKNVALRELLYRLFGAIATGQQPKASDLHALQSAYIDALRHAEPRPGGAGYTWQWPQGAETLERIGWLITQSAVDLLTSPRVGRVKMCASPDGCGWLFLDTSKNGSRRWCSMEVCGSRAKMRRLYARRRQAARA
jgi:predicted RNA-binding Zn ribbon-like protein